MVAKSELGFSEIMRPLTVGKIGTLLDGIKKGDREAMEGIFFLHCGANTLERVSQCVQITTTWSALMKNS